MCRWDDTASITPHAVGLLPIAGDSYLAQFLASSPFKPPC